MTNAKEDLLKFRAKSVKSLFTYTPVRYEAINQTKKYYQPNIIEIIYKSNSSKTGQWSECLASDKIAARLMNGSSAVVAIL